MPKPTRQATAAQMLGAANIGGSPRDIVDAMLHYLALILPGLLNAANTGAGVALPKIGGYYVYGQVLEGKGPFIIADSTTTWQTTTPAGHTASLPIEIGLVSNASLQSRPQISALLDAASLIPLALSPFLGATIGPGGQRLWTQCVPESLVWGPQQWQQYGGPLLRFNILAPPGMLGTAGPANVQGAGAPHPGQPLTPTPIPDSAALWQTGRNLYGRPSLALDAVLDLLERMLPADIAAFNAATNRTLPAPNGYKWDGETLDVEFPVLIGGVATNYRRVPRGGFSFAADNAISLWTLWGPVATRPAKADVQDLTQRIQTRLCGEVEAGSGPAIELPKRLRTNQGGYKDNYCRWCWSSINPQSQQAAADEDPANWRAECGNYLAVQYSMTPDVSDNEGRDEGTDYWKPVIERKPVAPEFKSAAFWTVARGSDAAPELITEVAATGVAAPLVYPPDGYPAIFEHEGDVLYLQWTRHPQTVQEIIYLDVATPANEDLLLAWSYWDGAIWRTLFFDDSDPRSILGLTRSGYVRFSVPPDGAHPWQPTLTTSVGALIDPDEPLLQRQPRITVRLERTAPDPAAPAPPITPPTLRLARAAGHVYGLAWGGDSALGALPEWIPGPLPLGVGGDRVPLDRLAPAVLQLVALSPLQGTISLDPTFRVIQDCGALADLDKAQEWDAVGGLPNLSMQDVDLPNPNQDEEPPDNEVPALFGVVDVPGVDPIALPERALVTIETV